MDFGHVEPLGNGEEVNDEDVLEPVSASLQPS
jgi:hypothetical protein